MSAVALSESFTSFNLRCEIWRSQIWATLNRINKIEWIKKVTEKSLICVGIIELLVLY